MAQPSILVLEDDEIIRSLMVDVLEEFGAHVTSFPSADEGMIFLERDDEQVDLIVSDIQMPGLLNGYDLSRVVAHRWPTVAVLLTSGNSAMASQLSSRVRFLPKPWSTEHLLECVQSALTQQGSPMHR
ncbi:MULTISPECIES: response regulator [Pseudomonas]|jgi:CheY-like chemotaxis protein|uniref:Response regulator n=2 Tax=Pseudomonas TaxID=286 RepID=A0A4Y9TDA5_PSEFL|nr:MULTISPECIES: response regulator [Pseudomonas]CRM96369.1 C4-dicarboxylate transport transcriptional regulatory protein DctD [Pseudomonas sp. 22 E 5]MCX9153853.1 response regulator [Pseudomonas sp. TB1-B1]QXH66567.1 response regulator [Pseudomonas asgharzadehiana]TFW40827.1 response regulator [Pseudomonas fluorescens]TKJ56582.1 response regulator [Pseudomonas sp. CFBP13506]